MDVLKYWILTNVLFYEFCVVAKVAIVHKNIFKNLVTNDISVFNFQHMLDF